MDGTRESPFSLVRQPSISCTSDRFTLDTLLPATYSFATHPQGKTTASTIKVADLTSIHNFTSIMSGSVTTFQVPTSLESAKPVV